MTQPHPIGDVRLAVGNWRIWKVQIRSVHAASDGWRYKPYGMHHDELISRDSLLAKALLKQPPLRVLKNV